MADITYFLPETRVRITGVIETVRDRILDPDGKAPHTTVKDVAIVYETGPDLQAPHLVRLKPEVLGDLEVDIGLTEDRRLTSVGVTAEGAADKILAAGLTVASTAAGLLIGGFPGALAAARTSDVAMTDEEDKTEETSTPEAAVAGAYKEAHGQLAERAKKYGVLRQTLSERLLTTRERLVDVIAEPARRRETERQLESLEATLADVEAELARLRAHFQAWRESTLIRSSETVEAVFEPRHLPRWTADGKLDWESAATSDTSITAREVWDRLLVAVARDEVHAEQPRPPLERMHGNRTEPDGIWVRQPRLVPMKQVENRGGAAAVVRTEHRLVNDDDCVVEFFPLEKTWIGKRQLTLQFSATGAMTRIKEGRSGAAALAETVRQLPSTVAGGLESAGKIWTGIDSLDSRRDRLEVERLTREIELRKKTLEKAGIDATDEDYVELERLKQIAELVKHRTALAGAPADLVKDLLEASWYKPPVPRPRKEEPPDQTVKIVVEVKGP